MKARGEIVNPHVQRQAEEPAPDFAAMDHAIRCGHRVPGSEHPSQSREPYANVRESRKAELMREYPKGVMPPDGYCDWFDWAEAQHLHGLRQKRCKHCGLWLFPQERIGSHVPQGAPK